MNLSPRYGHVVLASGYLVLANRCNWNCNMDVQYINMSSFICSFAFFIFCGYITNSQCDQLPVGLIAQLVEHLHRYRRGHGFESRFFDYCNIAWSSLLQEDQDRLQRLKNKSASIITSCIRSTERSFVGAPLLFQSLLSFLPTIIMCVLIC